MIKYILLIVVVCFILVMDKIRVKKDSKFFPRQEEIIDESILGIEFPYVKKYLLTKAEYAFWGILKKRCDEKNLIICPKVRLEDFIETTIKDNKERLSWRGRIKSRHIDFLVCDSKLNVVAGIELDDNTHYNAKAKEIDDFKNKVFNTIKIPLFRINMKDGYYDQQIEMIIQKISV